MSGRSTSSKRDKSHRSPSNEQDKDKKKQEEEEKLAKLLEEKKEQQRREEEYNQKTPDEKYWDRLTFPDRFWNRMEIGLKGGKSGVGVHHSYTRTEKELDKVFEAITLGLEDVENGLLRPDNYSFFMKMGAYQTVNMILSRT
jgi:hypothetical protein